MTPNFVVVVNVLMPICFHIGMGLPHLHIFVAENDALLDARTDKWFENISVVRNRKDAMTRPGLQQNNSNIFLACEIWLKMNFTFCVVLYRNQ